MELEGKTLPLNSEDYQRLLRWRSEFMQDYNSWKNWHEKKREWERFYDGDQLSGEEKKALRERNQPEVVINLIKPRIDGVIGDFLGKRVMMRARDKGSLDFNTAKHVTEALRFLEDYNRFDEQEAAVGTDLFTGGVGWYKVGLEFDFLEAEIRIEHISNDDIIPDRNGKKRDLSDSKRLYQTVWVEAEDLIELYPDFENEINEAVSMSKESFAAKMGSNYLGDDYEMGGGTTTPNYEQEFSTMLNPKRRQVRIINVYERVKKRIEFAYHPDIEGTVAEVTDYTRQEMSDLKQSFPNVQFFIKERWELNSGMFIHNKVLEYKENIRPHDSKGKFPFARAIGHVERSGSRMPYGMVRQYIDAQKEYNKRRSKLLHKNISNKIIAEEGAFHRNDIERVRKENARPDGVVMHAPGKAIQIDKDQVTSADTFLLQLAQSEIEASGVAKEFIGTENRVMSGKAIQIRQTEGQKMLRPFYASLRSARRDVFAIALEEMQQYWTSAKLVRISDDPSAGEMILNQRVTDEETGEVTIKNNLRLGKYDIKIDEDLETPNQRSEQFQAMSQLGQVALQAGESFPFELLIKSSDLPNKQEWLDAIKERKEQQMQMLQAQAIAAGAEQ